MKESENRKTQELSASDLECCFNRIQACVAALLTETPPLDSLNEALRQTRMLRRRTATTQASGLADLGSDFGKLLKVAGTCLDHDRAKANEIFQFILDRQQDWFLMNQFTGMDMFSEAWDIYQGLRTAMEERWSSHLLAEESDDDIDTDSISCDATGLTTQPQPTTEPVLEVVVQPLPVASSLKPALPALLQLIPPPLRRCESPAATRRASAVEIDRDVLQEIPITQKQIPELRLPQMSVSTNRRGPKSNEPTGRIPARPKLLLLIPPTLRRADVSNLRAR